MKFIVLAIASLGLVTAPIIGFAKESESDKPGTEKKVIAKKPAPALTNLTISGKVGKKETKGKDGKTYTYYSVTTEDMGVIRLTKTALGKKSKVNFDDLVDAEVTITGKGHKSGKGDKKRFVLKKIEKIEKTGAKG
jgi:hypothetical protein|tara:strand:- start:456 stop:863 length:408 start_codon:yes stop_codon:yes gene_type:complete